MDDLESNIGKLRSLREMGVNVAIDGFGTGYSSLGYLAKLPVTALKIDRSFIISMLDSPESMTIVSTIISLAHSLDLKVIAEGVDAEDQAKFLRLLKCDQIQGYLISKPVPPEEIVSLLGSPVSEDRECIDGNVSIARGHMWEERQPAMDRGTANFHKRRALG